MREIQLPSGLSGRDNYLAVITAPIIAVNDIHILYAHIELAGNMKIITSDGPWKCVENVTCSSCPWPDKYVSVKFI